MHTTHTETLIVCAAAPGGGGPVEGSPKVRWCIRGLFGFPIWLLMCRMSRVSKKLDNTIQGNALKILRLNTYFASMPL